MSAFPCADMDPVDCPYCCRTLISGAALADHLENQHEDFVAGEAQGYEMDDAEVNPEARTYMLEQGCDHPCKDYFEYGDCSCVRGVLPV